MKAPKHAPLTHKKNFLIFFKKSVDKCFSLWYNDYRNKRKGKTTMENKKFYTYEITGDYEVCGKISHCLVQLVCASTDEEANITYEKVLANPPKDCLGNIKIAKSKPDAWYKNSNLD
jgi:hypothetical protein